MHTLAVAVGSHWRAITVGFGFAFSFVVFVSLRFWVYFASQFLRSTITRTTVELVWILFGSSTLRLTVNTIWLGICSLLSKFTHLKWSILIYRHIWFIHLRTPLFAQTLLYKVVHFKLEMNVSEWHSEMILWWTKLINFKLNIGSIFVTSICRDEWEVRVNLAPKKHIFKRINM